MLRNRRGVFISNLRELEFLIFVVNKDLFIKSKESAYCSWVQGGGNLCEIIKSDLVRDWHRLGVASSWLRSLQLQRKLSGCALDSFPNSCI